MSKQMLLVLAALLLLAHISLNVNNSVGDMNTASYDNEAILTATNVAQSTLREVSSKVFDEKSITTKINNPDSLTSPFALGPEFGESYADFDDIDDFKGYSQTVSSGRLGDFLVNVDVSYTTKAASGGAVTYCSFLKVATVTVSGNSSLKHPVKLDTITAY